MTGFLGVPPPTAEGRQVFDEDVAEVGYVMNLSRLWAYRPALLNGLFDLMGETGRVHGLDLRGRGVLVAACASALGDSYCSLVWGGRLAAETDPLTASAVLREDDDHLSLKQPPTAGGHLTDGGGLADGGGFTDGAGLADGGDLAVGGGLTDGGGLADGGGLTDGERAMARWARKVARDPSGTCAEDVRSLREAGFDDAQIFAITVFVALRIAFSTVNAALGARPDAALRSTTPAAVLDAVTYGRPIAEV
ncbi:hypothetical protein [Nonomuraea sp. NPDC048916]|uniref:carboxymuconolactone decarboxylase family protein n=1 Tax=Nonomuraea sp. NPDC048916 TaxID=3154232 RepID=UPI0033C3592A